MWFSAQHFSSSPGKGGQLADKRQLATGWGARPHGHVLSPPSSPFPTMGLGWDISETSMSG